MAVPPPHVRALVLAAMSGEPVTTSDLYDRIGYPGLLRAGLIDYRAFRRALDALEVQGVIRSEVVDEDEGTRWRAVRPARRPGHPGAG